MEKVLIIIPTFNERENIEILVKLIFGLAVEADILFVDDNSPDGTGEVVDKMARGNPNRLFVVHREKKMGAGTAHIEGYKFALKKNYGCVIQMDADLSHHPKFVPEFLNAMNECDLAIGSRFLRNNARVVDWPLKRIILSRLANLYINVFLKLNLSDGTGGFKCVKRKVLEAINFEKIKSRNHAFQFEINYHAKKTGFKIKEIPIVFYNRSFGKSKLSWGMIFEAVFMVLYLKFRN